MKYLLIFWAMPLGFFWGWYFLSLNDMNFGLMFFSRDVHDLTFRIYGHILGIDPQALPPMVAKACIVDSLILFSIIAFRKRKAILSRLKAWRAAYRGERPAPSTWSRSSAP